MSKSNKPPVHRIRLGAIKATIWENETNAGVLRFTVTLARLYKDEADWKETASLGRDDLLLAGKVLDLAHTWICQHAKREMAEHEAD